jgi:hypothetical protein
MTPMAQLVVGAVAPLHQLLSAFRTGTGVPYADYGEDLHEGIARANRPMFTHLLAQEWIAAMPDIDVRLQADPPTRVADIGMGQGWSSIALARAYPKARIDGFDLDAASVVAVACRSEWSIRRPWRREQSCVAPPSAATPNRRGSARLTSSRSNTTRFASTA